MPLHRLALPVLAVLFAGCAPVVNNSTRDHASTPQVDSDPSAVALTLLKSQAHALAKRIYDADNRKSVVQEIVELGPPQIPLLRLIVHSSEPLVVRDAAAEAWAEIEVSSGVSIDVISERQKNGSPCEFLQVAIAMDGMRKRDEILALIGPPAELATHLAKLVDKARSGKPAEQIAALNSIALGGALVADIAPLIQPLLDGPSEDVARAAAKTLVAMGPRAGHEWFDAAISRDANTRRLMIEALANDELPADGFMNGRDHIAPILARGLADRDELTNRAAADGLCKRWPASSGVLTAAMEVGNPAVKDAVIRALLERPNPILDQMLNAHPGAANVDAQTPADEDAKRRMAKFAQLVVAELAKRRDSGAGSKRLSQVIDMLVGQLIDPVNLRDLDSKLSPEEKARLAKQFPEIFPGPLAAIFERAYSPDPVVRSTCIQYLSAHYDLVPAAAAGTAIKDALSAPSAPVRHEALRWASKISTPYEGIADPIAQSLLPGNPLYAPDPADRALAARLLGHFAKDPAICVPALARALDDREPEPRLAAITALRVFGIDAKPALPQLLTLLKTNLNSAIVDAAARTLVVVGPEGARPTAVYFIGQIGREADPRVQMQNIAALAQIGPDAAGAVPALEGLLHGSNNELRIEVARALGAIGPAAASAIPALTRMVDNRNADVRDAAADALARISPDGKGLGPALMAAVYNHDRTCSDRLAAVLRRAGPSPALQRRLDDLAGDDTDTAVRDTARHASAWLRTNP